MTDLPCFFFFLLPHLLLHVLRRSTRAPHPFRPPPLPPPSSSPWSWIIGFFRVATANCKVSRGRNVQKRGSNAAHVRIRTRWKIFSIILLSPPPPLPRVSDANARPLRFFPLLPSLFLGVISYVRLDINRVRSLHAKFTGERNFYLP